MWDDVEAGTQPRCPECGVVMRDDPAGAVCPECGLTQPHDDVVMPPEFDGPSLYGG